MTAFSMVLWSQLTFMILSYPSDVLLEGGLASYSTLALFSLLHDTQSPYNDPGCVSNTTKDLVESSHLFNLIYFLAKKSGMNQYYTFVLDLFSFSKLS